MLNEKMVGQAEQFRNSLTGNDHVSGVHVVEQGLEHVLVLALHSEVFLRDLVGFQHGVEVGTAGGQHVPVSEVQSVLDVEHDVAEPPRVFLQTQLVQDGAALRLVLRDGERDVVVVSVIVQHVHHVAGGWVVGVGVTYSKNHKCTRVRLNSQVSRHLTVVIVYNV